MNIQNEILIPTHKDWNEDRQVAGANSPHKSAEALNLEESEVGTCQEL